MNSRESEIIELIRKEVKPALGCTEPIAVALAVAKAVEILQEKCGCRQTDWRMSADFTIRVEVSGNILKNGMGVGIPGTGMVGLHIASALGAVCGKTEYRLEVLHDLNTESIDRAKELVNDGRVTVGLADTTHKLYVKACVSTGEGHKASALIEDDHDNIVETWFDDTVLNSCGTAAGNSEEGGKTTLDYHLTVREILDFASTVQFEDIRFILESRDMNLALAREGLESSYGLRVGHTIMSEKYRPVFGSDFMSYAMAMTAAASDARMAGCTLPAMSNSGSGNQGITVTMPVIAYSLKYDVSDEQLARALVLSHLIAIHIKGYLAIKNMIGNITGMVCDGAKVGCALKVASGVSCALQSAVLAMEGICISESDGIIEKDIEKTIRNLGEIGSKGMQSTDNMILDIMVCK